LPPFKAKFLSGCLHILQHHKFEKKQNKKIVLVQHRTIKEGNLFVLFVTLKSPKTQGSHYVLGAT
jgi:hypothetical protein